MKLQMPKLQFSNLFSSIIFFLVIGTTQFLIGIEKSMSLEQHVEVQQELSKFIAEYIKQNIPEMTDFKMHSVYTKPPKKNLLRAYFNYSFTTPAQEISRSATTELSGYAVLKKVKDEPQEWSLEQVQVEGEDIQFTDPVVITPSSEATPENN